MKSMWKYPFIIYSLVIAYRNTMHVYLLLATLPKRPPYLPISCHYCPCFLPSPHFSFPLPFLPFYNSLNSMNALICMAQGHPWRHGHPTMDHTLEGNPSSLICKWPSTTKRSLLRGGALWALPWKYLLLVIRVNHIKPSHTNILVFFD